MSDSTPPDSPLIRKFRTLLNYTKAEPDEAAKLNAMPVRAASQVGIQLNNLVQLFQDKPHARRPPAGECIYCGSRVYKAGSNTDLSEEHVISEAFGARYIVPRASCADCQHKINSHFETKLINSTYAASNRRLGIRGKKRLHQKNNYPVKVVRDGVESNFVLALDKHPTMISLLRMDMPGILCGRAIERGGARGLWTAGLNSHASMIDAGHTQFASAEIDTVYFCQFLAKVAHGFAVGELGVNGFEPLLTQYIRKDFSSENWMDRYHYIGGNLAEFAASNALHELGWDIVIDRLQTAYVVASIRLFASLGAPVYHVVTGYLANGEQLTNAYRLAEAHERTRDKSRDLSPLETASFLRQAETAPQSKKDAGPSDQ